MLHQPRLAAQEHAREVTIEVSDEHRQRVLTVTVSMHLERVHPPPVAPEA
jgi:hypothetical protein